MPFIELKQALAKSGLTKTVQKAIIADAKKLNLPEKEAGIKSVEKMHGLVKKSAKNVRNALQSHESNSSSQPARLYKNQKEVENLR